MPKPLNLNRQIAIQNNEKIFVSNTKCKKCRSYERYVSHWNCSVCAIKTGLKKLNDDELMKPYRTKEKKNHYRKNNKKLIRSIKKKYNTSDRGRAVVCEKQRRRYTRLKQSIPIEITKTQLREIQKIYQEAQCKSRTTKIQYVVDHIIPLADGGLHSPDNLQIITLKEHIKKTSEENSRRGKK